MVPREAPTVPLVAPVLSECLTVHVGLNRGSLYPNGPGATSEPEAVSAVARLLRACNVTAATILPGYGVWEGNLERTLEVRIIGNDDGLSEAVAGFAIALAGELRQDCVMVTRSRIIGSAFVRATDEAEETEGKF